ncbi:MAG: hypothetical protein JWP44_906 [Mucilaginibacter sp.]|nr:hypothetical protein [Mucilaginibacter sp.]
MKQVIYWILVFLSLITVLSLGMIIINYCWNARL